jgi:hypothetical protein
VELGGFMKNIIWCFLFILFSFLPVFSQEISLPGNPGLVKTATDLLAQKYPGYTVMKLSNADGDIREYFKKNYPKENPGLVIANFRSPAVTDCAALLVDSKKPDSGIKLFVLVLGLNTNKPEFNLIQDFIVQVPPVLDMYLLYEPQRKVQDYVDECWLDMTSNGFSFDPFDKGGERLFFWKGNKLIIKWVTD